MEYRGGQGGKPLPEPTLDHGGGGDDADGVRDLRRSLCCSGREDIDGADEGDGHRWGRRAMASTPREDRRDYG